MALCAGPCFGTPAKGRTWSCLDFGGWVLAGSAEGILLGTPDGTRDQSELAAYEASALHSLPGLRQPGPSRFRALGTWNQAPFPFRPSLPDTPQESVDDLLQVTGVFSTETSWFLRSRGGRAGKNY